MFDVGDGTTQGSCSMSNEKCQMSGACVADGKQLKNILVISISVAVKYYSTKSLSLMYLFVIFFGEST